MDGLSVFDLLQPDLLTVAELCEILHTKCVAADFSNLNKEELVEIFKRVALPLPQRAYTPNTSRGKRLSVKQKRREKNHENPCFKTFPSSGIKSKMPESVKTPSPSNRLKPPIDLSRLGGEKKIKLNSSGRRKSDDLDKIVINDKSSRVKETEQKTNNEINDKKEAQNDVSPGKHKKIRIDFSDNSEKSSPTPKVVCSKRLSNSQEDVPERKKHKRIVI